MRRILLFHNRNYAGVIRWLLLIAIIVQTPILSFSQSVVTGKVTSQEDGSPLPGVNVVIKDTSIGTTTDVNGNYTVPAPAEATLVFAFIGFTTTEVPMNGRHCAGSAGGFQNSASRKSN